SGPHGPDAPGRPGRGHGRDRPRAAHARGHDGRLEGDPTGPAPEPRGARARLARDGNRPLARPQAPPGPGAADAEGTATPDVGPGRTRRRRGPRRDAGHPAGPARLTVLSALSARTGNFFLAERTARYRIWARTPFSLSR